MKEPEIKYKFLGMSLATGHVSKALKALDEIKREGNDETNRVADEYGNGLINDLGRGIKEYFPIKSA
jgi:hypothetical protein